MKTKKLYAWVIAVAILLSQATPVRAEQGGTSYDQSEVCIGQSKIREISDADVFDELFLDAETAATDCEINLENVLSNSNVIYEYELAYDDGEGRYKVNMDIQFTVGNKTCVTSVNGTLSEVDLNEEETLLCGPLYGSVSGLNGSKVIVGFNQMLGCDDVSCYMTISMGNQTLVMRFGQDIFTPGQLSRLSDINNYEESDVDSELWTMDADDDEINITNYEKIGDVTATFDMMSNLSGAYGNAHKCEVYFKPATSIYDSENMLTFSVSSFCAELQAQFPYAYSSKIYEIETALLQADNTHGLVSPRVEDFNNYDELVIGQNNVNSGEAIIGMFAAIVQVLPLKCSYISAAVSFFSAWSPDDMSGISIYPRIYTAGNKLATTDTIFNTGRYFDDYPFLIELLLVGDRSQKTYNYVIESNVVYCQFSDGGYSYFSGNTASYEFSVDYVNI